MNLSHRTIQMQSDALKAVRAYLEPHPSWQSEDLRREALLAIRRSVGASDESLHRWYDEETKNDQRSAD